MVRKINFPCNGDGGCFRLRTLKCNRPMIGMDFRDTIKGSQKVQMPVAATEFAVCDGFEAAGFSFSTRSRMASSSAFESASRERVPSSKAFLAALREAGLRKLPTIS